MSHEILFLSCFKLSSTFVCPTEIIAFSDRIEEFRAINTEVVACSVDSKFTHLAWYVSDPCLLLKVIHGPILAEELHPQICSLRRYIIMCKSMILSIQMFKIFFSGKNF